MKTPRNSLMLAYILFLIVCTIYHAVTIFFDISFPAWEKAVLAATIASYAFSVSGIFKFDVKIYKKCFEISYEDFILAKKQHAHEIERLPESQKRKELFDLYAEIANDSIDHMLTAKKGMRKNDLTAFWFEVIGYLFFFSILVFEPLSAFLMSQQDLLTIGAFVIILLVNYFEDVWVQLTQKSYAASITYKEEPMKIMEADEKTSDN